MTKVKAVPDITPATKVEKKPRTPYKPKPPAPGAMLYTRRQAAEFLGVTVKTLAEMAMHREGPPFAKLGDGKTSPVRYPLDRLREWVDSRLVASKGDAT